MDELERAGRAVLERPIAAPAPVEQLERGASRLRRRRRARRVTAGLALLGLAVSVTALARHDDASMRRVETGSTSAQTPTAATTDETTPPPPTVADVPATDIHEVQRGVVDLDELAGPEAFVPTAALDADLRDQLDELLLRSGVIERWAYLPVPIDETGGRRPPELLLPAGAADQPGVFVDFDWTRSPDPLGDLAAFLDGFADVVRPEPNLYLGGIPSKWREWDIEVMLAPGVQPEIVESFRQRLRDHEAVRRLAYVTPEEQRAIATEVLGDRADEWLPAPESQGSFRLDVRDDAVYQLVYDLWRSYRGKTNVLLAPRYEWGEFPPPEPPPTTDPSADTVLVATGAGLLGWWDGGAWIPGDSGEPIPVRGGEQYRVVALGRPMTTVVGGVPGWGSDGCQVLSLPLEPDPDPESWTTVVVSGHHEVTPRPATTTGAVAAHLGTARELLGARGVTEPEPRIVQVVRADLDGDGSDEAVVVAEKRSEASPTWGEPGAYSLVFVRRVGEGGTATHVVRAEVIPDAATGIDANYLGTARVTAVADLNGDGTMELVLRSEYYEGATTHVYEQQPDGAFVEVLSGGCGS